MRRRRNPSCAGHPRRGTALIELLVALPLTLLVGALAIDLFVAQWRAVQQSEARWRTRRELDHAALVLASELRPLAAGDVERWTDSSFVARAVVLAGVVCSVPAAGVVEVGLIGSSLPTSAAVFAEPRVGDRLAWLQADTALAGLPVRLLATPGGTSVVREARRRSSGCPGSPWHAGGVSWRLVVDPPTAPGLVPGSTVRVQRRVEWRSYLGADGATYIGRRDWNGSSWSTIQPAAGPFHRGGHHALTLQPVGVDGGSASPAHADVRQVLVTLRARRRAGAVDSLRAVIALRGGD